MAGWGSSIKNVLFFTILSIPGVLISLYLKRYAEVLFIYSVEEYGVNAYLDMQVLIWDTISLLLLFIGVGIPFFKFLSDTVEDGMIEF
jgi:hypothetical protein